MSTLDDVLNGADDVASDAAPATDEAVKAAADVKPDATETKPDAAADAAAADKVEDAAPGGDAATKGDTDAATPAAGNKVTDSPEFKAQYAALQDERTKRKAAEARARELEGKAQKPERPDPFTDPKGADEFDRQQRQNELVDVKVQTSWAVAKRVIPDFEKVMEEHAPAIMAAEPYLYAQAIQTDDPAGYVYEAVKARLALREIGNPDEYRAKVRKEIEDELKASGDVQRQETVRSEIPGSLAGVRSAGDRTGSNWAGPTPLEDILS